MFISSTLCLFALQTLLPAASSTEICPDVTALHNVSVHFNYEIDSVTDFGENINFYHLENHTVIHVVRANCSVLCEGMVNSFRYLESLSLTNANISKILPEAFKQVPRLTSLSLAVNQLTVVKRGHLKNLQKLAVLYLSANRIETVDEDAFADLLDLRKIYLDKNQIFEINDKWFLNNAGISLINLAFNTISKVQEGAFTMRGNSSVEIRLQHNAIEEVVARAVDCGQPSKESAPNVVLRMDHNFVADIPTDFLKSLTNCTGVLSLNSNSVNCLPDKVLEELTVPGVNLSLSKNPLNCTCMYDMMKFANKNSIQERLVYNSSLECSLYGFSYL